MTAKKSAKQPPRGKTKLLTLNLDGKSANIGFADFVHEVLFAVGNRSQSKPDVRDPGNPVLHVNAAGELVVYVSDWSV